MELEYRMYVSCLWYNLYILYQGVIYSNLVNEGLYCYQSSKSHLFIILLYIYYYIFFFSFLLPKQ